MLSVGAVLGTLDLNVPFVSKLENAAARLRSFDQNVQQSASRVAHSLDAAGDSAGRFDRDIRRVDPDVLRNKLDGLSTGLDKFSRISSTLGLGLSVGLTAPLAAAGGAILKLGMDSVESENLVSVSFGNMKQSADEWSKGLSDSLGLNEFELRKTAGTLFNMTTSMGLAREEAFAMSTGVAELAADMASFRNIGMDEALTKIRAGLVGETEPLKAIGILVDENTVKQEAYNKGIARHGEELTATQKVQARWSAILRQTINDQGDLARTIDSPSNQLRIMRTRIEEAATSLGASLMPLFQSFTTFLSTYVVPAVQTTLKGFAALPEPVKMIGVGIIGLTAALGPGLLALGGLSSIASTLVPLLGMGGLAGAMSTLTGVILGPVGLVAALGALALAWAGMKTRDIQDQTAAYADAAKILGRGLQRGEDPRQVVAGFLAAGGSLAVLRGEAEKASAAAAGLQNNLKGGKVISLEFAAGVTQGAAQQGKFKAALEGSAITLDSFAAKQDASGKKVETAVQQYARMEKEVRNLSASKRAELDATRALDGDVDSLLKKYGLSSAHLKVYDAIKKESTKTTRELSAAEKEFGERITNRNVEGSMRLMRQVLADRIQQNQELIRQAPPLIMSLVDTSNAFDRQGISFVNNLAGIKQLKTERPDILFRTMADEATEWANALGYASQQFDGWIGDTLSGLSSLAATWANLIKLKDQYLSQGGATGSQKAGAVIGGAAGVWGATGGSSAAGNMIGGALAGAAAGAMIGTSFAGVTMGVSIAVGAIAGFTVGLVRSIAALSSYEKRVREAAESHRVLSDQALRNYGGRERLQRVGATVGLDPAETMRLTGWGAGREADPEALKQFLEELEERTNRLNNAMQKYGITLKDLGKEARQLRIDTSGIELANEFRELTNAGVAPERAIQGMSQAMNKFLTDTLDAGGKIPPALQPMIEQLIRAGQLTEENAALMLGLRDSAMPSLEEIDAAAKRYGITLDELGPKVNQLRINETAAQVVKDYQLMEKAGADMGAVTNRMAESVQGLVTQAMKFGLTLPESMKPIVVRMIEAGLLTDDTGKKMENLSRLTFAETLTAKIDKLVEALQTFVETITVGAVPALDRLGRTRVEPIRIPYRYEQEGPEPSGIRSRDPVVLDPPTHEGGGVPTSLTVNQYTDGRLMSRTLFPHLAEQMSLYTGAN